MGRRTYEAAIARLGKEAMQTMKTVVVSRTFEQKDYPDVILLSELNKGVMQTLRLESQKDIWLFGGAELFRALLELNEVDMVEISIMPVLLGGGSSSSRPSPSKSDWSWPDTRFINQES